MDDKTKEKELISKNNIIDFIIFYLISLLISFFYLFYYINKNISKILLSFCLIYLSLFLFLHFLIICDISIHQTGASLVQGMENIYQLLSYFYSYFNIFSYILRYLIFPFYIGYSKSGYFSIGKRIFDAIFHHYIKLSIIIVIAVIGFIIFLLFTSEVLDLYGKIKYFLNYLNFMGLITIYLNVGFFIVYIFIDLNRKITSNLINRYYNLTIKKLNDKLEKDIKKMKTAYEKLNEEVTKSDIKNIQGEYYNSILLLFEEAKSINKIYHIDFYNNNEKNEKNENIENKGDNEVNEDNGFKNQLFNDSNENERYDIKDEKIKPMVIQYTFSNIEKNLAPYIRTFKREKRKIIKIKFLITDAENKKKRDLNKSFWYKIFLIIQFLLFFLFLFVIIFYELLFPLGLKYTMQNNSNETRRLEENDIQTYIENIIFVFISVLLFSPYTIAVFYSIRKRKFITGNFLYGKNESDNLNLIETIKTIAGLAFPLCYCNYYVFYNILLNTQRIEKAPIFYEVVVIPSFLIGGEYDLLIFIKIGLMIIFAILSFWDKICCLRINDGSVREMNKTISSFDNVIYDESFNIDKNKLNLSTI